MTRKDKAEALWKRLKHGPHLHDPVDGSAYSAEKAHKDYVMWAESWVLHDLASLVKELNGKVDEFGNIRK